MDDNASRNETNEPADNGAETPAYRAQWGKVVALAVLAALPIVLTAIALPFLPDAVPTHYGAGGDPDQWGPKSDLFVPAGILCTCGLVVAGIVAVLERQRETGREDWIVPNRPVSFPTTVIALGVFDLLFAVYLFMAFQLTDTTLPSVTGHLYIDVLLGLVLLCMISPAVYMLVTGKGLSLVNFHPGSSQLERNLGADKQQARAIGGLLLFLALFVIVEFMIVRW